MEESPDALRPLLFSIAYRMLGRVGDAEDVVQESYARMQRAVAGGERIESTRAYLCTVATRLAIDELRSARVRRETYVGAWMPEPLLTDEAPVAPDPSAQAEKADTLTMAFLLVLERLTPVERAVFLLHDVFGYGYDEVAAVVGKGEANCRQLAARARRHLREDRPRSDTSREEQRELAARFLGAAVDGDVDRLVGMLAEDAVAYGDGGGNAPQWSSPIRGGLRVARMLAGLGRTMTSVGATLEPREVNGQPGALVRGPDGRLVNVLVLDVSAGAVQTVRSVINPDKLRHLGPVADAWALLRSRGRNPADPADPGGNR